MRVGFIGRREELALLERAHAARESAFIPIYGRRRVGKSELILKFLESRRGIYFVGKQAPSGLLVKEFLREAAVALDEPLLATASIDTWQGALTAVFERWRAPQKCILALDEFQWIAAASPELPSTLQELWDRHWSKAQNVLLILCGSYVGFMEREVLGRKSPLFGRRTAQILLRPFGYREAAEFHPSYSLEDRARTYFLCGGMPFYLRFYSSARSIEQNIAATLLDEHGPLRREPEFLLREELRDVENYYAALNAIASGHAAACDISRVSGIGDRALHYYLQQLCDLGYVRRRYPLTGAPPAKRHVRFAIEDPLLRFWFRFVFPNSSYVAQRGPEHALRDRIRPELASYFGSCFEALCREALPLLYEREGVTAAFDVGEYWDKSVQVDVVGLRDDGWTDLGECKWGAAGSARALLGELERKVALYPNKRAATIGRRLFTQKPPPSGSEEGAAARWHDLRDLYHR